MAAGISILILAYVLSQYFRTFIAVLTGDLSADLGATEGDLAVASGAWFIVFAAMQIPIGWALDTLGPRRVASVLMALGCGGGAAVFAAAGSPLQISVAMGLIGMGCAPILMASYYILARMGSPAAFATMAGMIIGFGSLGNIASSAPTVMAIEAIGWRGMMWALAGAGTCVAGLIYIIVRDPPPAEAPERGSFLDILKIRALWLILPLMFVNYVPAAALRGLWIGPYGETVIGADETLIGRMTLFMALAMVAGSFAYGPLDRLVGSRKWVIFTGNLCAALACVALWLNPDPGLTTAVILFCAVGFFGASFPVLMAHGRAFVPAHLTGRGVTMLNLFGIGGVGFLQIAAGRVHEGAGGGVEAYGTLFGFFAILLLTGLAIYLFCRDRTD